MSEVPLTSDSYMIHTLQRHREILNVSLAVYLPDLEFTVILVFICNLRVIDRNSIKFKPITPHEWNVRNYYEVRALDHHHR